MPTKNLYKMPKNQLKMPNLKWFLANAKFHFRLVSLIYLHNLHWLHLFGFSPVCIIHSTPRLSAFSNRLAVNKHSRSCSICLVFKCTLKLLAWTGAKSRTHCIFLHFSTMCAFSNRLPEKMYSRISCICLIFLNCVIKCCLKLFVLHEI